MLSSHKKATNQPMIVKVKHQSRCYDISVEDNASVSDLRKAIEQALHIPVGKQRLLGGSKKWQDAAALLQHDLGVAVAGRDTTASPPHVMVVGAAEVPVAVADSGAPAEAAPVVLSRASTLAHLVCSSVETEAGMYSCSFPVGYAAQDAFYCRTCAEAGYCEEKHLMCYACAEVCHEGHNVENWGLHNSLRCDCCTVAGCTPVALAAASGAAVDSSDVVYRRCKFLTDERTGAPPSAPLLRNSENQYPPETKTWCYCKGTAATTEEEEEGLNCMMCHNVCYAPHITHLYTHLFHLVSCYAETSGHNTLGYRCVTCEEAAGVAPGVASSGSEVLYCPPCLLHCHTGHVVSKEPVHVEWRCEGTKSLVCGCRAACAIAHAMPDTVLLDKAKALRTSQPPLVGSDDTTAVMTTEIPQWMATQLVEDDEVSAFICARCMLSHPWLWRHGDAAYDDLSELRQCRKGRYIRETDVNVVDVPVLACGTQPSGLAPTAHHRDAVAADVFPYHGMLVPDDIKAFLCQCADCQRELAGVFPRRVSSDGLQLFIPYEDTCCHCSEAVERSSGHLCATCELQQLSSYFLCDECFQLPEVRAAHARDRNRDGSDAAHEFVGDTFENLWRVFGAALVGQVDPETKQWMLENWSDGAARDVVLDMMRGTFGTRRVGDVADAKSDDAARDEGGWAKRRRDDEGNESD